MYSRSVYVYLRNAHYEMGSERYRYGTFQKQWFGRLALLQVIYSLTYILKGKIVGWKLQKPMFVDKKYKFNHFSYRSCSFEFQLTDGERGSLRQFIYTEPSFHNRLLQKSYLQCIMSGTSKLFLSSVLTIEKTLLEFRFSQSLVQKEEVPSPLQFYKRGERW
jgi:hypothetical protein